jgi:hypothetical protein
MNFSYLSIGKGNDREKCQKKTMRNKAAKKRSVISLCSMGHKTNARIDRSTRAFKI